MAGGRKIHGAHANDLHEYEGFFECEWDAEQGWRVTVRCVPSSRKAATANQFEATALPQVLDWLKSPREESWFIGHYVLQVGISEFTDELALRIVHNDHVLEQKTLGS